MSPPPLTSVAWWRGVDLVERVGEAFELGEKLTVIGARLQRGVPAPEFELDRLVPETAAMETVRLSASNGRVRILNIVNSLDTPVCQVETRRWDAALRDLPDIVMFPGAMELPFAQSRWCGSERTGHASLSAHRSEAFGRDYGVLIKEWRLLQPAGIVLGPEGRGAYAEYVAHQIAEPGCAAALEVASAYP